MTRCFLLQVWEALYQGMTRAYFTVSTSSEMLEAVKCILSESTQVCCQREELVIRIEELMKELVHMLIS